MIQLQEKETGALVGSITERQLQTLKDLLEEESEQDADYYIDGPTLDMLEDHGADAGLVDVLRRALGSREGIEITWARPAS